jgi:hypothetical protein
MLVKSQARAGTRARQKLQRKRATATPSEPRDDWSPVLHILLSLPSNHHRFSDTIDEHSQHRLLPSSSHICKTESHRAANRRTTHYFRPAFSRLSRDRLQAKLHRPHRIHATVAVLRNGDVIGKSNQ